MSKAKLPVSAEVSLQDAINLYERAIKFPSDQELFSKINALPDRIKFAVARWKRQDGYSLLHALVSSWSDDIRGWINGLLLDKGASENIDIYYQFTPSVCHTPLTYLALLGSDKAFLKRLLENSTHPADILRDALDQPNASELLESFLSDYAIIRDSVNSLSELNRPAPLLKAARKRNMNAFNHLMRNRNNGGNANPQILSIEGNNILHEMILGIAENNPDGNAPLSAEDQAFFERLINSKDFNSRPFEKNIAGKSPITLACELGQNAIIARFINLKGFLTEFRSDTDIQIRNLGTTISKLSDSELKNQLKSNLDQLAEDFKKINLDKSTCSIEELTKSVKKVSKINGLLFELEKLTASLSSANTPDDFNNAKNTFVQNCEGKLYSEEIQARYNALIGVIIGLAISAIIASTLLLVATGGIATFGAATILTFVTTNIAITAASGAVATVIIAACGYSGYNYGEGAKWRANFFAVASAVEEHVPSSNYAPLREYK